jgi:ankyrin repeat protein
MASRHNRALLEAAEYNNGKKVTGIIKRGADINTRNEFGRTPILIAVDNGNLAVVRALIKQRADVNIPDTQYHITPIHVAANKGHLDIIRALIEYGADFNTAENNGFTPVYRY